MFLKWIQTTTCIHEPPRNLPSMEEETKQFFQSENLVTWTENLLPIHNNEND